MSKSYNNLIKFLIKWLSNIVCLNKKKKVLAINYNDCETNLYDSLYHFIDVEINDIKNNEDNLDLEIQDILNQLYNTIIALQLNNNKQPQISKMSTFLIDIKSKLNLLSKNKDISQEKWDNFFTSLLNIKLFKGKTFISNIIGVNEDEESIFSMEHYLETKDKYYIIHEWKYPCKYKEHITINDNFTIKDLLVSFFEIKSCKHDLWRELFIEAKCKITPRSLDLVQKEKQYIKDIFKNIPYFEQHLTKLIHDYAYDKNEMSIYINFDHGC